MSRTTICVLADIFDVKYLNDYNETHGTWGLKQDFSPSFLEILEVDDEALIILLNLEVFFHNFGLYVS